VTSCKALGKQRNINKGDRVVVVEDVVTTAGSVIKAIIAVQQLGAIVEAVFVIVDREEGGAEKFKEMGINYQPIFTISELL